MKLKVDLFSDTGTRPSKEMREFMAKAEVGDEQLGEDPSVNRLNEMVAELLGKEDAIYLPSGLMANQISFAVHCRPGDEIIMDKTAHPIHFEGGAVSVISGASINPLDGENGIFTTEQVIKAIRTSDYHHPRTRLISIEQTSNLGGGTIWPLDVIEDICQLAREHNLKTHMDGARLLNAVAATGIPASKYAEHFDSIWIDLSKGLGAPVGSVLASSRDFIEEARYWKQRLGGAMRQAGIIAAGGIYALKHNLERLQEDNDNARYLAEEMARLKNIEIDPETVETNIVIFKVKGLTAEQFSKELIKRGVRVSIIAKDTLRAVTHLDVNRQDIDYALTVIKEVTGS
ncbi:threonine aldolase family protein [Halothermothrix orenii]|uniref:Threonine aldolase n=1 Tax=Halothermothrix orenii (strain H 168 / OCM 544 / DSM 9562) TaxID=373903 RepID=B8CZM2_HALOH|nr:low specificity L-threonine aldolase [Halothermothrix orenii]ACL70741.1 threonine aldolase [Halothermothrix orenii H 168]